MNEAETSHYIATTFAGVDVVVASGDSFFFYKPDSSQPADHRLMFTTIVTSDISDQFSNLNRPAVFRLNMGINKQTFLSLFGEPKRSSHADSTAESGADYSDYDFTTLDQLMPHPVYGRMYWVCVLNPSAETFETKIQPLLADAYELAVSKYNKQVARKQAQA